MTGDIPDVELNAREERSIKSKWTLSEKDKKVIGTVWGRDRRTFKQLYNYYKKSPRRIMPRLRRVSNKLSDAVQYYNEHKDNDFESMSTEDKVYLRRAYSYKRVWTDFWQDWWTDTVAHYNRIQNGDC